MPHGLFVVIMEARIIQAHSGHVNAVAFSPDGSMVVSAGFSGELRGWNLADLTLRHEFVGHTHSVNTVLFVGERMITGSRDGSLRVWSPENAACISTIEVTKASRGITALFAESTADILALTIPNRALQLRSLKTLEIIGDLKSSVKNIGVLALSARGDRALVGGMGPHIQVIALPSCQQIGSFEAHPDTIGGARFFDDDRRIATVGGEGTLAIWESATSALIERQRIAEQSGGYYLAVTRRAPLLGAVSGPQAVRLFDLEGRCRLIDTLSSPIKGNYGLSFSADGRHLALASADKRVRLWGVAPDRA